MSQIGPFVNRKSELQEESCEEKSKSRKIQYQSVNETFSTSTWTVFVPVSFYNHIGDIKEL